MQESRLSTGISQSPSASPGALHLGNVLMATDFSEISQRALAYAIGIASRYSARLHLFHCVDSAPYNMGAPDALETAREAAWRDMEGLASEVREARNARIPEIKPRVEAGDTVPVLCRAAGQLDAQLIIVGTHGRAGWKKLVLGSIAEKIVDYACCPVLTVGPASERTRMQHFGPQNILLADDISLRCPLAESYSFSLARKYGALLTRVDVVEERSGRVLAKVSKYEWRDSESTYGVLATEETTSDNLPTGTGTRSDLILWVAEETRADLLVLPVPKSYSFVDRVRSSYYYRVLCDALCPVLTVHAEGDTPT
jgi:nucleotide-binding universal stress UspA family protein